MSCQLQLLMGFSGVLKFTSWSLGITGDHFNKLENRIFLMWVFIRRSFFYFGQKTRTDIVMDACCSLNPAIDIGQVGAGPLKQIPFPECGCGTKKDLLQRLQCHKARYCPPSDRRCLYSGNGPLYNWRAAVFPRRCPVLSELRWVQNSYHHGHPREVQRLPLALITNPTNHLFLQGKHPNLALHDTTDPVTWPKKVSGQNNTKVNCYTDQTTWRWIN